MATKISIPQQLQNPNFRFIKIAMTGSVARKRPLEKDWVNKNNYRYNDSKLLKHISAGKNYGVVLGYGHLAVIDADSKIIEDLVETKLPETFIVQTGGGGKHYYFIIPDLKQKIILYDQQHNHHGEVQFTGSQVIGPSCIHPNGKKYEIIKDVPIATIKYSLLEKTLGDYIQKNATAPTHWEGDGGFCHLDITKVVDLSKLKNRGREYQGSHPVHGSTTGSNFCVNPSKGTWHCFRCNSGGGPLSLIAVLEKIINCNEAKPGALKDKKFRDILRLAREKYGLDVETNIDSIEYPLQIKDLEYKIRFAYRKKKLIYSIIRHGKEGIQTEVPLHFFRDEKKRNQFYKNVASSLGVEDKKEKKELEQKLLPILEQLQESEFLKNAFKRAMEVSEKEAIRLGEKTAGTQAYKESKELTQERIKLQKLRYDPQFKIEVQKEKKKPGFLVDVIEEVKKEGVSGEEDTILALIILSMTRLVKGSRPESKNLLLSDVTGIGKDYVTKKTLETILPGEDYLHVTKMTPEAFTYWHMDEENWTWDGKVIHFEDITQGLLDSSTFKVMASGGSYAVVVKEQKTIEIPINGKPCMILTSHHVNPQTESLRRFPVGALDESKEQTQRIKDLISKKYGGSEKSKRNYVVREAVRSLKPYEVKIPFAELVQHFFPNDILLRTHYQRFLDYICASAVFHQEQRPQTEDGVLIAMPDDYMVARIVLIYTTFNPKMIPVSKEYRDLLALLGNEGEMTVNEIFLKFYKSKIWLYRHLPRLTQLGLVVAGKKFDDQANKEVITYRCSFDLTPSSIPTWGEICDKIEALLPEVIGETEKSGDKIFSTPKKDEKIKKTEKNSPFFLLKRWFYQGVIKLKKPSDYGSVYQVFSHVEIPFSRRVLSVFPVFSIYLRERQKKYVKFLEHKENTLENEVVEQKKLQKKGIPLDMTKHDTKNDETKLLHLDDKIKELKEFISREKKSLRKVWHKSLKSKFSDDFINQCIERGYLIKLPDGSFEWGR